MDMIISPDIDSAWLTLKQFCAIFNLTINVGITQDRTDHYASIRDLDIQRLHCTESATGWGSTREEALIDLAKVLSSGPIIGRDRDWPHVEVRP